MFQVICCVWTCSKGFCMLYFRPLKQIPPAFGALQNTRFKTAVWRGSETSFLRVKKSASSRCALSQYHTHDYHFLVKTTFLTQCEIGSLLRVTNVSVLEYDLVKVDFSGGGNKSTVHTKANQFASGMGRGNFSPTQGRCVPPSPSICAGVLRVQSQAQHRWGWPWRWTSLVHDDWEETRGGGEGRGILWLC